MIALSFLRITLTSIVGGMELLAPRVFERGQRGNACGIGRVRRALPQPVAREAADRFRVAPAPGGRGWTAGAEPARYGHTGRLSFHLDQAGSLRKEDKGGKPVKGT